MSTASGSRMPRQNSGNGALFCSGSGGSQESFGSVLSLPGCGHANCALPDGDMLFQQFCRACRFACYGGHQLSRAWCRDTGLNGLTGIAAHAAPQCHLVSETLTFCNDSSSLCSVTRMRVPLIRNWTCIRCICCRFLAAKLAGDVVALPEALRVSLENTSKALSLSPAQHACTSAHCGCKRQTSAAKRSIHD